MQNGRLAGQVAIVTGASRNIGFETAKALSAAGASVVINSLNEDGLSAAAEAIRAATGGAIVTVPGDVCDPALSGELARAAMSAFGGVDIIVNNALVDGGTDNQPILGAARESWDRKLEGYLFTPIRLLQDLHESMRQRGRGSVINVISGAAFTPIPGMGSYGVTKAAMWALTRHLAKELAPDIRVNAVCPGTTSHSGVMEREGHAPLLERVPLKRMGRADECASAVMYLVCDATYTTAQIIYCDGGRSELISP